MNNVFILMGNLVTRAGLSQELYKASYSFLGTLADPLSGLVWSQLVVGGLCCSLVALLTHQLCHRELPALAR